MTESKNISKKSANPFGRLFQSVDNLLAEGKEQKLKSKLGKEIKNSIFTSEIASELNEYDFSGIIDEEETLTALFSSIFPVFVKKDDVVFRLYKHKIEVDLSDEMRDRYIYMFSDGRLTSGLFQCFNLSDAEYCYGIKKIIDVIPLFKDTLLNALADFKENADIHETKLVNSKERENLAEKNYNDLISCLSKQKDISR